MADPKAFPDKEKENQNEAVDKKIDRILGNIDFKAIDKRIEKKLQGQNERIEKTLIEQGLIEPDLLSSEDRKYVESLPSDYRSKALRYLDIFRDNPELVTEYLQTLKKFGSEKDAKKAGATNVLFYPNKVSKHITDNADIYDEETQKRWFTYSNPLNPVGIYDLAYRVDKEGRKIQKEHYNKTSTKWIHGITEPVHDSVRALTKVIAGLVDTVGPSNTKSAVDYLEANWPKFDDITYPNKDKPSAHLKDSWSTEAISDLTQFGIDYYLGGKLFKFFGAAYGKAKPGQIKKITEHVTKRKPKTDAPWYKPWQKGKPVADSFGNIKYASSIAQKMEIPIFAAKYGTGRALTSETTPGEEKAQTFSQGFGWLPTISRQEYNKMTKREQAVYRLKHSLIHGGEGSLLIGGLTKAIGIGGKAIWGGTKWAGRTVAVPAEKLILNPISNIMKSRKTGIPQLAQGIRNAGGFVSSKVLKIPSYKDWAFFNTTQGPLKERILGFAESKILPPLRVRGPWPKEAKEIMLKGEQMIRGYKKEVGVLLSQIDRSIYNMMNKGFTNKIFTTSSVSGGRQYWDDVISFLKGEVKIDALPIPLREPSRDIQKLIEKLSKEIRPYVKSDEIKKEILDGMGKYLTTSYKIFQGSFKPGKKEMDAATSYFAGLLKKTVPKYKKVKPGDKLWDQLQREASIKVEQILKYGTEGSSPAKRLNAITGLMKSDKILAKKQNLPKVIEDLMGKVDNPMAIIMDTVSGQAELLSHLFTHKSILREGLRSGWITTNPEKFAVEGVQKWVAKSLVPIKDLMRTSNIDIAKIYTPPSRKVGNYFTTPEIANALKEDTLWTDFLLQQSWYKPVIAAKTTAQLSKTVLSIMTQARNFETAMFFSIMQGHVGSRASVMEAMKYVFGDVIGKGKINPIAMRKKLKEWSDVGILDTSVVGGEVQAVIGDLAKGKFNSTDAFFKALMSNPIFRKATEFYQGSDSVWKAYGYEFTKSQLVRAIPIKGLSLNEARALGYVIEPGRRAAYKWSDLVTKQFDEVFGMRWDPLNIDGSAKTYGDALKQIAGKYIRDVYPNYNIVPNLVAGWRRLPMGNFIAFRSENIRNVFNTMVYSMRELSSSNPYLRQMGAKRMLGLTTTLYGLEEGLRVFTSTLTNIEEETLRKYQRWLSPWYDKTATLFPVSKMDPDSKKFWTLNWTREQPYEGVQDAFAQMFKEVFNPVKDDMAMGKRFFNGFFYNFEEKTPGGIFLLFEPFITPSLLLEKIQDIAPSAWTGGLGNDGITKEGFTVYDVRNDSVSEMIAKMFAHLLLDINPATIKNAKQSIDAAEGTLTRSGKELNTLNQVTKMLLGLGLEEQDPINQIPKEIGDFTGRIKKTNEDFRRDTSDVNKLINDPFLLKSEFENLQANRYRELSRIYEFVMFLKNDLKMTRGEIMKQFKGRGGFGTRTVAMILNGRFDAANLPPTEITSLYPKILERINRTDKYKNNPLKLADIYNVKELNSIRFKWQNIPLGLDNKQLDEYFLTGKDPRLKKETKAEPVSMVLPRDTTTQVARLPIAEAPRSQTPLPPTPGVSQQAVAQVPQQVGATGLTATETALLSNEEKAMKLRQRGMV